MGLLNAMKTFYILFRVRRARMASTAFGHGIPIAVSIDENNKLVVSNPEPLYEPVDLTSGYASMVLVDNEDGAVMDRITFSNNNPLGLLEVTSLRRCPDSTLPEWTRIVVCIWK